MKIKVCGMRERENVAEVALLRPDYMGFIFYPRSPRHCGDLDPDVVRNLPEEITPVAVTVNMEIGEIERLCGRYAIDTVQLHGDESPDFCRELRERGLTVFKAKGVKDAESVRSLSHYEGAVDMFVLDTASAARGGTGKKFDWNLLPLYSGHTPFMLSGGIGPEDAEMVLSLRHPSFAGIDLNSRFEQAPGLKDATLLDNFFKRIRL
ncbi:MAG: phosphoribosylanthranilate isomerase [Muribaculaceae bacterium]|nr:phosphoribosylanthranilate isomerase [Muribaculaceae bacterium]